MEQILWTSIEIDVLLDRGGLRINHLFAALDEPLPSAAVEA